MLKHSADAFVRYVNLKYQQPTILSPSKLFGGLFNKAKEQNDLGQNSVEKKHA